MSDMTPGGLATWFGEVNVRNDLDSSAVSFLTELMAMLDVLQPTLVDIARSSVRQDDRASGVEVEIVHQVDADATISVSADHRGAIIFWLSAHEHIFPEDATSERPWTTVAVDAIAEILCGEYVVEEHYRGSRLVKIRIIDAADPDGERVMETIGTLLAMIPWPGPRRIERRRIDFGAHRPPDVPPD